MRYLLVITIFMSPIVHANVDVNGKVNSQHENIFVHITSGDSLAIVVIEKKGKDLVMRLKSNTAPSRERKLVEKDYDYIVGEYKKLKTAEHLSDLCYRNKVEIDLIKDGNLIEKKSSCYGLKTKTEPGFARFIKILNLAI